MAALTRYLSAPVASAPIKACAIFFICANLLQNYATLHQQAVGQHANNMVSPNDHLPPVVDKDVLAVLPERNLIDYKPFTFVSGSTEYDTAYNIARQEIDANTVDGKFVAGSGWGTLWTRDTAYAIELGAGILSPDIALRTLMKCNERDPETSNLMWVQDDCMNFGRWPNLSDSIVGAQAAWHLYLLNGDKEFLEWALSMTKNTLQRAERDAWNSDAGLFKGCSLVSVLWKVILVILQNIKIMGC